MPPSAVEPPFDQLLATAEAVARAVVAGQCVDLVAADPGAAVRARSAAALQDPGGLHDPEAVSASYLISAQIMQL